MKTIERILRGLFWLPIFLGGTVGFSFVEPRFFSLGLISAAILGVLVVLLLLQGFLERKALAQPAKKSRWREGREAIRRTDYSDAEKVDVDCC